MRKVISLIICMVVVMAIPVSIAEAAPENGAHAMVLYHPDSGTVLYSQNADERMLIASTTKVMTALVVLDNSSPSDEVEIDKDVTLVEGSSMYLKAGKTYTVEELLYGLMLVSGNDAALALANHVSGSEENFAKLMNRKAVELGLKNSSFRNPHGLDDEAHYSSAYDLALIMAEAMRNDTFRAISGTRTKTIGAQTYINHNKLLWNYDGVVGGKTGYTMAAGRTLISCCDKDGMELICVTISDPDDWDDHEDVYDWAYENYEYKNVIPVGEISRIPVISGVAESVGIAANGNLKLLVKKGAEPELNVNMPQFVFADVQAGENAGEIIASLDGEVIGRAGLCYTESVKQAEIIRLTAWERFKRAWHFTNKYSPLGFNYYPDTP